MLNFIKKIQQDCLRRDEELVKQMKVLIKNQNVNGQVSLLAQQKEILSHLYQKASSYTNLIILAGYAGIFGIWNLTRELLNKQITIWVAFLVSCSLVLFVGFEVWKMIAEALFFRRVSDIIEKDVPEQEKLAVWKYIFNAYSKEQAMVWIYFLIPTVLLGFSGGFILIYQFVKNL